MSCTVQIKEVNAISLFANRIDNLLDEFKQGIDNNFETETSGNGIAFKDWAESTVKARQYRSGHYAQTPRETSKILQWTQTLKDNTKIDTKVTQHEIIMTAYNNTSYAGYANSKRPFIEPQQGYKNNMIGIIVHG